MPERCSRVRVRSFLAKTMHKVRADRALSQEKMAEYLDISARAYGDIEKGRYNMSSATLLHLLLMMNEEEILSFLSLLPDVLLIPDSVQEKGKWHDDRKTQNRRPA